MRIYVYCYRQDFLNCYRQDFLTGYLLPQEVEIVLDGHKYYIVNNKIEKDMNRRWYRILL